MATKCYISVRSNNLKQWIFLAQTLERKPHLSTSGANDFTRWPDVSPANVDDDVSSTRVDEDRILQRYSAIQVHDSPVCVSGWWLCGNIWQLRNQCKHPAYPRVKIDASMSSQFRLLADVCQMMVLVPIHGVLSEKIEHMVSLNPLLHHFIEASLHHGTSICMADIPR